jgi:hypothetical protein
MTVLLLSGSFSITKTTATFVSLLSFIDRFGRRKLLLIASVGIVVTFLHIGGMGIHVSFSAFFARIKYGNELLKGTRRLIDLLAVCDGYCIELD